ncbi:unnamed protein product, partial [Amoebophrya sp. A25]|eukprot:GSA25T00010788001.1
MAEEYSLFSRRDPHGKIAGDKGAEGMLGKELAVKKSIDTLLRAAATSSVDESSGEFQNAREAFGATTTAAFFQILLPPNAHVQEPTPTTSTSTSSGKITDDEGEQEREGEDREGTQLFHSSALANEHVLVGLAKSQIFFGQRPEKQITPFFFALESLYRTVRDSYSEQTETFQINFSGYNHNLLAQNEGQASKVLPPCATLWALPAEDSNMNIKGKSEMNTSSRSTSHAHVTRGGKETYLLANRRLLIPFVAKAKELFDDLQSRELLSTWTLRGGSLLSSLRYGDWWHAFEVRQQGGP